jgi:Ca2+-binding EF-hand superfamily protein
MSPEEFQADGAQIVDRIVSSWTSKYMYHIARLQLNEAQTCHYQVAFSQPLAGTPVPAEVLRVIFSLENEPSATGKSPAVAFGFESSDLVHYWALERDRTGWKPVEGQQFLSLGFGSFESFIESRLMEKDDVRSLLDLRTNFEESRLLPPPAYSESEGEASGDFDFTDEDGAAQDDGFMAGHGVASVDVGGFAEKMMMKKALQAAGLPHEGNVSLPDVLACIFDAADETSSGALHHHEVMQLLTSTLPGLGLELWDIHMLMSSAQENEEGLIEYKAFVQAAPEIIQALRLRRASYAASGLPKKTVTEEAVQMCNGEEIIETVRVLAELFEQCADPSLEGLMSRSCFHECLACRHDRVSPQELLRLMQMMPEDEEGRVRYDELQPNLEKLRSEALHNALVETDIASLRKHLILLLRRHGLTSDSTVPIWNLKRVLLQADQLCLTRLQIHVLLCMSIPNFSGMVDVNDFLQVCCGVIPRMFDSEHFTNFAQNAADESAAATKRAELAELEAMTKGMQAAGKGEDQDAPAEEAAGEVDREQVEKSLTHAFSLLDDGRRGSISVETMFKVLTSADAQVQSCQLSEPELRGLVAELVVDQNDEVAYKEHVQTWVPILFELRKTKIYEPYLQKEPFLNTPGLTVPDLSLLEMEFPLLPPELVQLGGDGRRMSRRLSKGSKNSSKEYEETTVKRSRLKAGGRPTRESTIGSSHTLHSLRMKRATMEGGILPGSKRNSLVAGDTVRRNPTLEGKRTLSNEDHPAGAGRGERRREARGVIAPQPPPRRNSKDQRGNSKERLPSKEGNT